MTKYFDEVDFSDVREELTKTAKTPTKAMSISLPTRTTYNHLFEEINTEFNKLEAGTSLFRKGAITFTNDSPARSVLKRVFKKADWTKESLEELVKLTKQDYGMSVGKWVAEKLSPYHSGLQAYVIEVK